MTVMLKYSHTGFFTLAHPRAEVTDAHADVRLVAIDGVPDGTPKTTVLHLANRTAVVGGSGRVNWSDLGFSRIARVS